MSETMYPTAEMFYILYCLSYCVFVSSVTFAYFLKPLFLNLEVLAGKRRASLEATQKPESSNSKLRPEDRPESLIKLLRKKVPKKHKKLK